MVDMERLDDSEDIETVQRLIRQHAEYTGSTVAAHVLADWSESMRMFVKVMPHDYKRALAELGFIVIQLDHMGTPKRSKAFHDFYYGNMGDNGIPDHIAAIRQLAAAHDWIDINKVGIYGFSGGGFASTDAMFRYPDFFKVAASGSGNHDNRTYGYFWGEKYQGLYRPNGASDNYEAAANYTLAKNLKGKLLLAHGTMDNNVPPDNTLLVVDALIKANEVATPRALVDRIQGEVVKALASPKMRETMEMGGHTPIGSTPAEFRKYLEGYLKEMALLAKETGVKPL